MPRNHAKARVERGLYRAGNVYFACTTPTGRRQAAWKTLGEVGIMEARRLRDEFIVDTRRSPAPPPRARATFGDVAEEWLADQQARVDLGDLAARTFETYEHGLRRHCLPHLGRCQLRSITADDLVAWHRRLRTDGYAPDSILAWWTPLRLVFRHAVRHRLIEASPVDRLMAHERPKAGSSRQRFLTRREMSLLLAASRSPYRLALACGLFGGLRVSEVLGLVWNEIDPAAGVISVRHQMARDGRRGPLKTEAARRDVVLMAQLGKELREFRLASRFSNDQDLVFATATGSTIGHRNLTARGLEPAATRADLSGVTFHVLRHTFASMLIAQGHDPVFVARQLGHANPAITLRVYAHLFDAARHADHAREQLDADYGNLLSSSEAVAVDRGSGVT